MAAKFELCVKVIGVVLFFYGAVVVLLGIPFGLHPVGPDIFLPTEALQGAYGQRLQEQMQSATSRAGLWTAIHLLLARGFRLMERGQRATNNAAASVAELADAPGLGPGVLWTWRFDSSRSQ